MWNERILNVNFYSIRATGNLILFLKLHSYENIREVLHNPFIGRVAFIKKNKILSWNAARAQVDTTLFSFVRRASSSFFYTFQVTTVSISVFLPKFFPNYETNYVLRKIDLFLSWCQFHSFDDFPLQKVFYSFIRTNSYFIFLHHKNVNCHFSN